MILSQWNSTGNQQSWWFAIASSTLSFYYSPDGSTVVGPIAGSPGGFGAAWHHVAVDRDASNVLRVYLDGVVQASSTVSASFFASTTPVMIGNDPRFLYNAGYIDEARITIGKAQYGGAFTPPAAPFVLTGVTWNPSDKDAAQTLSGGNFIATSSAGSGTVNSCVRATQGISPSVKTYFEVTVSGTLGQYLSIGVMNGSASLAANVGATNGIDFVNKFSGTTSSIYLNGVNTVSVLPVLTSGQVVRVAVDRTANKIWFAINNNTWSGSAVWMGSGATTDDPATGTGGASLSTVTGTIFPATSSAWTGDDRDFPTAARLA